MGGTGIHTNGKIEHEARLDSESGDEDNQAALLVRHLGHPLSRLCPSLHPRNRSLTLNQSLNFCSHLTSVGEQHGKYNKNI